MFSHSCNGTNIFYSVKDEMFHSTRRMKDEMYHSTRLCLVEWNISSFTSWKYLYHCTHKHSLFVYSSCKFYCFFIGTSEKACKFFQFSKQRKESKTQTKTKSQRHSQIQKETTITRRGYGYGCQWYVQSIGFQVGSDVDAISQSLCVHSGRPVARIDFGGAAPPKSGPFGPPKWTFWTSSLTLLQKPHFWYIL